MPAAAGALPPHLDRLNLDEPIASDEGLDVNHTSITCILAVIPRIPAVPQDTSFYGVERFSWSALSLPVDDDPPYSEFMRTTQVSQLIMSQARANQDIAHVLRKKFRTLRIAFLLGLATILAITLQWIVTAPIG